MKAIRQPALPPKLGARNIANPQPGFFRMRMVKGGVYVPARIFLPCPMVVGDWTSCDAHPDDWCMPMDRSRWLKGEINLRPADLWRVWGFGQPIPIEEFEFMVEVVRWAKVHAPESPEAKPWRPIDLRALPPQVAP